MKKNKIFKIASIVLTFVMLLTQIAYASDFSTPLEISCVSERIENADTAIKNMENAIEENNENEFQNEILNLYVKLKQLYPEEFHDNLDELDNSYAPNGGLTERDATMSNIEATLDALKNAGSLALKKDYLDSLSNDIKEVEYKQAEQAERELNKMLEILEDDTITSEKCTSAVNTIEKILRFRYPEMFISTLSVSEKEVSCVLEKELHDLKQQSNKNTLDTNMINSLRAKIHSALENDPFLMDDSSSKAASHWTVIDVPKIMQETDTWCSAAVIQQTLKYINGTIPYTQSQIIKMTGEGPSLATVLNFINNHIDGKPYGRKEFNGPSSFYRWTLRARDYSRPVIFTFSNDDLNMWDFKTDGHFTNCAGYVNFNPNDFTYKYGYLFSDPYCYYKYISNVTSGEEGLVGANYDMIKYVNGRHFKDEGKMIVGAY